MNKENKALFVGIVIGILLTTIIGEIIYTNKVKMFEDDISLLNIELENNTQLAYEFGFNAGAIYVANYTTLTGNFSYLEGEEFKTFAIKDYCDLNDGEVNKNE